MHPDLPQHACSSTTTCMLIRHNIIYIYCAILYLTCHKAIDRLHRYLVLWQACPKLKCLYGHVNTFPTHPLYLMLGSTFTVEQIKHTGWWGFFFFLQITLLLSPLSEVLNVLSASLNKTFPSFLVRSLFT